MKRMMKIVGGATSRRNVVGALSTGLVAATLGKAARAAMPHLSRGAAVINTASVNAYDPSENIVDYAATKGAIMISTKGLAKQVAAKGIRVNAVAPGPFWTPLQVTSGQPPGKIPKFGVDTPMGRPGQPAELAGIYVLLASSESSYATGQVYGAVGGRGGP
jgi:NAD(P)-dependent dehydrogenase (short-subunit alcohol dehydrogenase family)